MILAPSSLCELGRVCHFTPVTCERIWRQMMRADVLPMSDAIGTGFETISTFKKNRAAPPASAGAASTAGRPNRRMTCLLSSCRPLLAPSAVALCGGAFLRTTAITPSQLAAPSLALPSPVRERERPPGVVHRLRRPRHAPSLITPLPRRRHERVQVRPAVLQQDVLHLLPRPRLHLPVAGLHVADWWCVTLGTGGDGKGWGRNGERRGEGKGKT